MAAWGLLLTATAGSQPIVASTVIGAGANIYKLQEIFPPGPSGSSSGNTGARVLSSAHRLLRMGPPRSPASRSAWLMVPACTAACGQIQRWASLRSCRQALHGRPGAGRVAHACSMHSLNLCMLCAQC
jgi:hypothetical protein